MGCRRYQEALSEAAAGALALERRRWLDEHLAGCPGCAEIFERRRKMMAAIDATLLDAAEIEPSPQILLAVEGRIAQKSPPVHFPWPSVRLVAAAAALVVTLLVVWATGMRHSSPPQPLRKAMRLPPPVVNARPERGTGERATFAGKRPVAIARRAVRPNPGGLSAADRRMLELAKIPPERDEVVRLYRLLQSGRVDAQSLPVSAENESGEISIAPIRIKPLEIAPVKIPPLNVGGGSAGAGEQSQDLAGRQASDSDDTRR